jgi:hypothetical protein
MDARRGAHVIEHARVVLLRPSPSGYEMLLLRRNEATQLPGGGIHDGEDARVGAARTVFEDCGVLLARDIGGQAETLEVPTFATLRRKIRGGANATELLRTHGLTWSSEALMPWSHWLMPAIHQSNALATLRDPGTEPAPTSTRVCVAELPGGMRTAFDKTESVSEHWISPASAEVLAEELALSPLLVRTCWELARHVSVKAVLEIARKLAGEQLAVLPRLSARAGSRCLLLPWDPEYETAGQGESRPFTYQPSWAIGPSRFVLEDRAWKHLAAPGSTPAD